MLDTGKCVFPAPLVVARQFVYHYSTPPPRFSTAAPLVVARQFVQLSSHLSSPSVYGLGQHLDGLMLDTDWSRYTLWNADQAPVPGVSGREGANYQLSGRQV